MELITIAGTYGSGPGELLSCKIQISQALFQHYTFLLFITTIHNMEY